MRHQFGIFGLALLMAAAVVGYQSGCQHLNSPTGQRILNIALRLATYEVVQKNPDLVPYLTGFVKAVGNYQEDLAPERLQTYLNNWLAENVPDPYHRLIAAELSAMLADYYRSVYEANIDRLAASEYRQILDRLADAIAAGITGAPASGERYQAGAVTLKFL